MKKSNISPYYAFISYKHKDKAPWAAVDEYWAITIYDQLVKWRIPAIIDHEQRINSSDVFIRPVFRDGNEMGAGKDVTDLLHQNLDKAKSLVVICSEGMIKEQREKRRRQQRRHHTDDDVAYIFEEIDYFLQKEEKGPVILVWADSVPFDKNNPNCMPPQFMGTDIMVIDVNSFPKSILGDRKKRVSAQVAAGIFNSNRTLFWDYYKRRRRELYLWTAFVLTLFIGICLFLWNNVLVNSAYRLNLQAQEHIDQGNRFKAMQDLREAYENFRSADGLSTAMWQCLDNSQPLMSIDSHIEVCPAIEAYAIINNNEEVILYDTRTQQEIRRIQTDYVEQVKFSADGKLIALLTQRKIQIMEIATQKMLSRIDEGTTNYPYCLFGDGNTQFLCYNDRGHYQIFSTLTGNTLFQSLIYAEDTEGWTNAGFSYIDGDSLLLIYGKEAPFEQGKGLFGEYLHEQAQWACKIYDTRRSVTKKRFSLQLHSKIDLPHERITYMKASQKHLIVTTIDRIYVYMLSPKSSGVTRSPCRFPNLFVNWAKSQITVYKRMHPDWNEPVVTDIRFSPNGSKALVIINDHQRFSLSLSNYGASTQMYNCNNFSVGSTDSVSVLDLTKQQAKGIGISDNQEVLFLNPWEVRGPNLFICDKRSVYGFCRYSLRKPVNKLPLEYDVYMDDNIITITEREQRSLALNSFDRQIPYVQSYIYQRKSMMSTPVLDRLKQQPDYKVGGISPSGRYVLVSKELPLKKGFHDHKVVLWDMERDTIAYDLSAMVGSDIDLSYYSPHYLTSDETLLNINCWMPEGEKSRTSSEVIIDLNQQKILYQQKGYSEFMAKSLIVGDGILLVNKEKETVFYDVKRKTEILRGEGTFTPLNKKGIRIVMIHNKPGMKEKLVALEDGKLTSLPLEEYTSTYGCTFLEASANGEFIAVAKSENLLVIDTHSGIVRYEFPLFRRVSGDDNYPYFATFTPDGRYLLYSKERNSGFTKIDLLTGKEVFIYQGYHQIAKVGQFSASLLDGYQNKYWGIALSSKYIALHSHDLQLLDLETGEIYASLKIPLTTHARMAFSPDGHYLIADNNLIDVRERQCISQGIKEYPRYFTNRHIIYEDEYLPIVDSKGLYQAIKRISGR